jgi:isovaleryl-CoA dehydrogenase
VDYFLTIPPVCFPFSFCGLSLLLVNNLAVNGNHENKARFLPDICSGAKIGGMGMSEPNAGTDVLGMKSKAVFDKEKNGWILNGQKVL